MSCLIILNFVHKFFFNCRCILCSVFRENDQSIDNHTSCFETDNHKVFRWCQIQLKRNLCLQTSFEINRFVGFKRIILLFERLTNGKRYVYDNLVSFAEAVVKLVKSCLTLACGVDELVMGLTFLVSIEIAFQISTC